MNHPRRIIRNISIKSGYSDHISDSSVKVIQEVNLSVYVDGNPLANIACAGIHLKELAIGFLRSEKIISDNKDIEKLEFNQHNNRVNITLKKKNNFKKTFIKNISSSGARGKTNLTLLKPLRSTGDFQIKTGLVLKLMDKLLDGSVVHNQTGGTHCSALVTGNKIIVLREDIGRHNTIDMLGGYALLKKVHLHKSIILTTGRISSEIVYKIWNMSIPVIISHSAATADAVRLSRKANISLIGYVRHGKMNIYSHERRVII